MERTKEEVLNEQRTLEEIKQMPTRMKLETLMNLRDVLTANVPAKNAIMSEQRFESVWEDYELEIIKLKILTIVRDL